MAECWLQNAALFLGFTAPWLLIGWVACQQWNDRHTTDEDEYDDTRGDLP